MSRCLAHLALVAAVGGLGLDSYAAGLQRTSHTAPVAGPAISGTTRDLEGRSIPFVQIRILPRPVGTETANRPTRLATWLGQDPIRSVLSDALGRFTIQTLPPGAYRFVAEKGGYLAVVGQLDTLAGSTLDLVLRPAGPPGLPGEKPENSSWLLRVPERDLFESRRRTHDDATIVDVAEFGRLAVPRAVHLTLDQTRTALDVDGLAPARGVGLAVDGSWTLGRGSIGFDGRYRRLEQSDARSEESQRASLWYALRPDDASLLSVSWQHRSRDRSLILPSSAAGVESDSRRESLELVFSRSIETTQHELRFDLIQLDGRDPDLTAIAARFGSLQWAAQHDAPRVQTQYRAQLRAAADGWRGEVDRGAQLAVTQLGWARANDQLGQASGSALDLGFSRRQAVAPSVFLMVRARGEYAGGLDQGLRAATSVAAQWSFAPWFGLEGEVGGLTPDGSSGWPWRLQLAGNWEHWSWSLARHSTTGLIAWQGSGRREPSDAALLTDHQAQRRGWDLGFDYEHTQLSAHLRISRAEAEGRMAARLQSDSLLVPIEADGSALERHAELTLQASRWGTSLAAVWRDLEDQTDSSQLLAGARRWRGTSIELRQRIPGLNWSDADVVLLVGYDHQSLDRPDAAVFPLRSLWLSDNRVSSGLILSF